MVNIFRPSKTLTYVKHGNPSNGYWLDGCTQERTIGKRKVKLLKYYPASKQILVEENGKQFRESLTGALLNGFTLSSKEGAKGLDANQEVKSAQGGIITKIKRALGIKS